MTPENLNEIKPEQLDAIVESAVDLAAAARVARKTGDLRQACADLGVDAGVAAAIAGAILAGVPAGRTGEPDKGPLRDTRSLEAMESLWPTKLLRSILGDERYEDLMTAPDGTDWRVMAGNRLSHCLMAIPSWHRYAALVKKYSGEYPDAIRAGRNDNIDLPYVPGEGANRDKLSIEALAFLRDDSRVEYVATGKSDLGQKFGQDDIELLTGMQIHVLADLKRLDDRDILEIQVPAHVKLGLVDRIYHARADVLNAESAYVST